MPINLYNSVYQSYFTSNAFNSDFESALKVIQSSKRIFFIGNGGSNSICSHMGEDYAKIAGFQTFTFSDAALITCFSNDFGYENAMAEWLKIYFQEGDLLVAISSSGNSNNILNAVELAKSKKGSIITLSGFDAGNQLRKLGHVNFYIGEANYGIVECFHQVILHVLLDKIAVK
jgi:D-sedoheptulose 7-phosphate isomerase